MDTIHVLRSGVWTEGHTTTRKATRAALAAMLETFPALAVWDFVQHGMGQCALLLRENDITATHRRRTENHLRWLTQWADENADAFSELQLAVALAGQPTDDEVALARVVELFGA